MRLSDFVSVSNYTEGGIIGEYNKEVKQEGFSLENASGTITLITPTAGKALQIYRFDMTVLAPIGRTYVKLGATNIFDFLVMKPGSMHGGTFVTSPITGGSNNALRIVLPSEISFCVNVSWLEV